MYTVLKEKTAIIDCQDLQTAIRFVQSLESGMDRHKDHSPYTIVKTSNLGPDVRGQDPGPYPLHLPRLVTE